MKVFTIVLILLSLSGDIYSLSRRKIVTVMNPNIEGQTSTCCATPMESECYPHPTLVHVAASGTADMIHHLWDFTDKPVVYIALTSLDTTLLVDWKRLRRKESDYIAFSRPPFYSAALVLNRIWQFNDGSNTGSLPDNDITPYSTSNMTWTCHKTITESAEHAMLEMVGTNSEWFGKGQVRLTLKTAGDRGFDGDIPYMVHSENGTLIDMVLNRLNADPSMKSARFAVEVILLTSEQRLGSSSHGFEMKIRKSLDDEHTPGVFNIIEIYSPDSLKHNNGSYIYYRPISYTSRERVIASWTDVHISAPKPYAGKLFDLSGLLVAFFETNEHPNRFLVQSFNISFGWQSRAYKQFNTWTFELGYGAPPEELLSRFVVIVTTVGFVFPMMCLFFGGIVVFVKRLRTWFVE